MRPNKHNTHARPRLGRPKAAEAGEINLRIVSAATELFLDLGFSRTALDQVAEQAHVGKTTLYGRFPTKESLFEAVVSQCLDEFLQPVNPERVQGTVESKLVQVGEALAQSTLTHFALRLMRMVLAETTHFPQLARNAYQLGLDDGAKRVAQVLALGEHAIPENLALEISRRFVEMALHPLFLNALFKNDLDSLHTRVSKDVVQVARMLCWDIARIESEIAR